MEHKIYEVITYNHNGKTIHLKVTPTKNSTCQGCFFHEKCKTDWSYTKDIVGTCDKIYRSDKTSVIFKKINNNKTMNENIDLIKILKDCPKGFKLYSPISGYVTFVEISLNNFKHPIIVKDKKEREFTFSKNGKYFDDYDGECCLFPSKEQRDWSKFTAPWYNKESIKPKFKIGDKIRHKETNKDDVYEISKVYDDSYGFVGFDWMLYMKYQDQYELVPNKFDPKNLIPFDKVLVRDSRLVSDSPSSWWRCQIFSFIEEEDKDYPYVCIGESYSYCIPYNDDTKHLVGTNKEEPKFYKY